MRLPRDVSGRDFVRRLREFGFEISCRSGGQIRRTRQNFGEHQVTIPDHVQLRVGTLAAIVAEIARHHGLTRDEMAERSFRA